jgi:hypothetical protein
MANLGQNSVWNSLDSETTNIMGPSYSYADNIQSPSSMGVGSNGTISQIGTNTSAITNYIKYMISGPALGNRYFVNTGGTCVAPDKSIQSRYNYINNVTDGADTLPAALKQDLGGIASDFNGLLPGMLQDMEGLNPMNLFKALASDSEPSCDCYQCDTTGGPESRFLTTDLTPDFDSSLCQKVDISNCIQSKEGFTTMNMDPMIFGGIFLILLSILMIKK